MDITRIVVALFALAMVATTGGAMFGFGPDTPFVLIVLWGLVVGAVGAWVTTWIEARADIARERRMRVRDERIGRENEAAALVAAAPVTVVVANGPTGVVDGSASASSADRGAA